jgi:heme ABC exporter ATP-binding subunit CcmA
VSGYARRVHGPAVDVVKVARSFGSRWAVAGVSLSVPAGGALMITGANGSGKSTLLRCLATALRPQQGSIRIDGLELWENRHELRMRIGWLAHQLQLYEDLSPRENLQILCSFAGISSDVGAILERVGLDPSRNDPVKALSAGMRRRAALARLLVKRAGLVLLDEPFAALDPTGRELLLSVLADLRRDGTTLILATHMPGTAARACDDALHLHEGRITWTGPAKEHPGVDE